jgi:heme a synthase
MKNPTYGPARRMIWSHRLALLLCATTLVLIVAGALVVGTGSSLAVPDWPLAYGQIFPPMVGGILFEHGHRIIASIVGILTVALALWLHWNEPRRWVRWLGWGAFLGIVLQGALGGITVLFLLPKPVSIAHALLAQLFFVTAVLIALVTSSRWYNFSAQPIRGSARFIGVFALCGLEAELILGALVRHFNAGLAIPDFPLSLGQWVPPLDTFPVAIHYLHRLGALLVTFIELGCIWAAVRWHRQDKQLSRLVVVMAFLLAAQIALGASIVWTQRGLAITTIHVANAGLLVACTALFTARAWRLEAPRLAGNRVQQNAIAGLHAAGT